MDTGQLIEAAQQASKEAKRYKQLIRRHRAALREASARVEAYRRQLADYGITLILKGEEDKTHGRHSGTT